MTTYTDKLLLPKPDAGACGWNYAWYKNFDVLDAVNGQDMLNNYVVEGCALSLGTLLSINVATGSVIVGGSTFTVTAGSISVSGASAFPEAYNIVYVDDAGALKVYPADAFPSGDFALLGVVDTDATTVIRTIADLRKWELYIDKTPVENDCINGTFDIWQRGTSQTSSAYGSSDRFTHVNAGTTKVHSRQAFTAGQTDVPGNPKYYSRTVVTSVVGSGNLCATQHRILDVSRYSGETVCLSFYAKADSVKDIAIEFQQYFGPGGSAAAYVTPQKVTLSASWQKFVLFFDVPSVSLKTIVEPSFTQLMIWFDAGSGSDARTDTLGQQSGTFDISDVELYISEKELPVRRKTAKETLADCLPYCQVGGFRHVTYSNASGPMETSFALPAKMVVLPSATVTDTGSVGLASAVTYGTVENQQHAMSIRGTKDGSAGTAYLKCTYLLEAEL